METWLHNDPLHREEVIRKYLLRRLDAAALAEFESHFLECPECFDELRAAELLISGLGHATLARDNSRDIAVLRFAAPAELTSTSLELSTLARMVEGPGDTKVLIDLSQVSRIDSAGLGMLMRCYTHAVRNEGMLKLLNPTAQVRRVLAMTRIDSVVPTFADESAALDSFE